jgi:hypothetical protein
MVADRRIANRERCYDDACKMVTLETRDGVALLGYAGLGATAMRTQPSDWTNAVLRGPNAPMENALGHLADSTGPLTPHVQSLPPATATRPPSPPPR